MILLLCATETECRHALARLDIPATPTASENVAFRLANQDVLACVLGIGPVATALGIGALLERFPKITGILNLGICGSFDLDRWPLGSVCVASAEIWPEYGLHGADDDTAFGHQMFANMPLQPINRLDLAPADAAAQMGLHLPPDWRAGISLTVAGVSADQNRAQNLHGRFNAATENMEGFALALAARKWDLPFLELRTVSNPVGIRAKQAKNFHQALCTLEELLPLMIRP